MMFVPGLPIAQGSKKAFQRGSKIVLVESAAGLKSWRAAVTRAAQAEGRIMLETEAITLSLMFMMPGPKKPVRRYPTTKPDLDKLTRAIADSLTGVWYKDDSQIVKIQAEKCYTYAEPGVYIAISHLDNSLVTNKKS
jgi:Holliday junction resolvase RusA-like endonuclease